MRLYNTVFIRGNLGMIELLQNRSQRLQFEVSSPNGILLFREASSMLVTYGQSILEITKNNILSQARFFTVLIGRFPFGWNDKKNLVRIWYIRINWKELDFVSNSFDLPCVPIWPILASSNYIMINHLKMHLR